MNCVRPFLISVMAFALLSSTTYAAEDSAAPVVHLRGSDKSDYSRLVLDWGSGTSLANSYKAQKNGTDFTITFPSDVTFDTIGFSSSLSRLKDYKIVSPRQIDISVDKNADVQHFVMGNRLIIDIKGRKIQPSESKPKDVPIKQVSAAHAKDTDLAKATPATIEAAAGDAQLNDKEKAVQAALKDEKNVVVDMAPPEDTPKKEVPAKTYSISMTSTVSVPIAVYERNGYIWLVQGKEDIKLPPQILGPNADELGQFEPVPNAGGGLSLFRIKSPQGFSKVAAGGGLAWKIDFTNKPNPKQKEAPIAFKGVFEKDGRPIPAGLLWPASLINRVTVVKDPDVGDSVKIVLVERASDFTGDAQAFVDFDVLPSLIGAAIIPKTDGLIITKSDDGLFLSKEGGLNIASDKDRITAQKNASVTIDEPPATRDLTRIFDFKNWQVGDKKNLSQNQRLLMSVMSVQTDAKKAEGLISLAKLNLSFNYAPEAVGYLELAQSLVPELDTNPEYIALSGAAEALSWKQKEAYQQFSNASLNDIGEIAYWKAYTLAKLDDWQQAAKTLPNDATVLSTYTDDIKVPLALTFIEIALREGNASKAKKFFDVIKPLREGMYLPYASAYDYLIGERERQNKNQKEAKRIWKELSTGLDDLYRAKARFALAMMLFESKEITEDKAIDDLEGLRYAWRGDDLEVSINHNLAKIYLKKNEPVKALTLMKLAYNLNPTSEQGKKIDADMRKAFVDTFAPENIKLVSPVDTLVLYSEFSNLIPQGVEGEALTRQLAERMVSADLLPRAITLLKKQIDAGATGIDGATVGIRLATLQTMDAKPDEALQTLDKAEIMLKDLKSEEVLSKQEDIGLLRAKALSMKGKTDEAFEALTLLPQNDDSLRLRADIAWSAKRWQDAADSLEQLVQNQNINLARPLSEKQADLLLNWGVALYLADNRYVLANLRERYSDAMAGTTKAKKFEVVTRPRQATILSDRETINSIIDETSIFKDFLKSFRSEEAVTAKNVLEPIQVPNEPQQVIGASGSKSANVPEALKNVPGLKADEVLGD